MRRARRVLVVAVTPQQMQVATKAVEDNTRKWWPGGVALEMRSRQNPAVPYGAIRLVVEFPGSGNVMPHEYPKIETLDGFFERWNAGERDGDVTRALYPAGLVEPYIDWFSNLVWRATDDGKKEGLK